MPLAATQLEHFIPQKHQNIIWAQARVAFLKINKSSFYELEDLFSIGLEVYYKSLPKWEQSKGPSVESFLTLCLKSRYVQVVRDTFAKKRGGAGCKADDIRFGRGEKWADGEIPDMFQHVSIDADENGKIDIPANENTDFEYEMLTEHVGKFIPKQHYKVYKQLISPDEKLKDMIVDKYKGKLKIGKTKNDSRFLIDDQIISEYLNIKPKDVEISREVIGNIIKEKLGISL